MLEYALSYAKQGFKVFPCVANGKRPLTTHGFHDATADPDQIEAWWTRWADANIGIPTGRENGILVADVDRHGKDDGMVALRELALPRTRATRTPHDGLHLIYAYPETGDVGRLIGVKPGIDLLGNDGYIIAAGSSIDGRYYEVAVDMPPAPCPPILLELAAQHRGSAGAAATLAPGGKVGEGRRNEYLASVAGIMRRDGFDADSIEAALQIENEKKCEPSLPPSEVATIARSIARYEPAQSLDPAQTIESGKLEARLEQLAKLSRLDYDRERAAAAKDLGIRASTLDEEVSSRRDHDAGEQNVILADPEPWPSEVDGAELLTRMREEFSRFVVLPPHAASALALWALHSWCVDSFFISPYLHLGSPQKRCGKSTLLMVLAALARRPLAATSASPAAIFRCIEKYQPTLLLDEADTWLKENEELRGILNGGHSKRTAYVLRTVGDDHDVHAFATFCPKAFAGIGKLVDTLEDRCISIALIRKRPDDRVARLREDDLGLTTLRRKCLRWATDHAGELKHADPATPASLHDRAADNWRCLLAIADLAGGSWPAEARAAGVKLSADRDDEAIGTQLLADIRALFGKMDDPDKPLASATLVEALGDMEDRPWSDWRAGKPITKSQIARLLKPYEIRPRNVRIGAAISKGYHSFQFEDAFARYLPGLSQAATSLQSYETRDLGAKTPATPGNATPATPLHEQDGCSGVADPSKIGVAAKNERKGLENKHCSGVAVQTVPEAAGEGATFSEVL